MSGAASEFIDEPPTWREIVLDILSKNETIIYAAAALFFSAFAVVGASIVIHIHWFDVGWVATVEAHNGMSFADETFLLGLYGNVTVYTLAAGASLWSLFESRSA